MSLSRKLYLCFGVLFLSMIILAGVTFVGFHTSEGNFDTAVDRRAPLLQLAGQYEADIWTMRASQRGVQLYTYAKKPENVQAAKDAFQKSVADAEAVLKKINSLALLEATKEEVRQQQRALEEVRKEFAEVVRLNDSGDFEGSARIAAGELAKIFNAAVEVSHRMVTRQQESLAKDKKEGASSASASRWTATVVVLFALGVGIVAFFVVRSSSNTLGQLSHELAEGAEQVASASVQVSSSSQSLAQGASEQAASLEETSSSTEEIGSMTRKNADNSDQSAKLMADMAGKISEGNHKLNAMVTSMNEISASSEKISKIIKTIDEIAFQTNILALNAAVEAARAGEAGMGFAVVADEVRNLAQRCAQAAKDTSSLIEDSVAKSQEGGRKLDEVAKAIGAITADAEKVKTLVDEVQVGSEEQARGLDQISKAVSQMEQVTQKAAANAEESAAAGEELNAQADAMRNIVSQLVAVVGASGKTANSSATSLAGSAKLERNVGSALRSARRKPSATVPSSNQVQGIPLEGTFEEL